MRIDYNKEKFTKVRVCGIECDFSDMRIDQSSVPRKISYCLCAKELLVERLELIREENSL